MDFSITVLVGAMVFSVLVSVPLYSITLEYFDESNEIVKYWREVITANIIIKTVNAEKAAAIIMIFFFGVINYSPRWLL